jgi:ABC-type thiamine transport system substrate-binding protein
MLLEAIAAKSSQDSKFPSRFLSFWLGRQIQPCIPTRGTKVPAGPEIVP